LTTTRGPIPVNGQDHRGFKGCGYYSSGRISNVVIGWRVIVNQQQRA
jgi:hypothetical protein